MAPWMLVTPASRGIGLELARQLLRTTKLPLVATARKDLDQTREKLLEGDDMKGIDEARLSVLEIDVTKEDTIAAAAEYCKTHLSAGQKRPSSSLLESSHLHLGLIVPGILHPEKSPQQIDHDTALDSLRVNLLGPMLMAKHFAPLLPKKAAPLTGEPGGEEREAFGGLDTSHAIMAFMSARVGSITDNTNAGGWYSYRCSKAGVNQLARSLDRFLYTSAGNGAGSVALHPGTVKTGLSEGLRGSIPEDRLLEAPVAADRLLTVLSGGFLDGQGGQRIPWKDARGKCWDWQGVEIPP